MAEPRLERLSVDELTPHPDNPRLSLREDVIERLVAEMERGGFGDHHAILARPYDGKYQVVAGHHRLEAARRAGLEVPTWITELDDDEAFMQLVLSNTQGELTPLEEGKHIFTFVERNAKGGRGNSGGVREYARRMSLDPDAAKSEATYRYRRAAFAVYLKCEDVFALYSAPEYSQLYEISKAPELTWRLLGEASVKKEWTVAQTAAIVTRVGEFTNRLNGDDEDWLPLVDVVKRHLDQPERFTPSAVAKLIDSAAMVDSWIERNGTEQDAIDFRMWLVNNKGGESWDYRKIINYRAELVAKAAARAEMEALSAKIEVPDWHQGSWEDHISNLADGSVSLMLTDPPYGMDYQSDYRVDRSVAHKHEVLEGDSNLEDAMAALQKCVEAMQSKLTDSAHLLVFCQPRTEPATRAALEAAGYTYRSSVVWVKNNTGMGDPSTTFAPKHERIMHYVKGSPKLLVRLPDVLEADRVKTDRHPTEKPVDLLERLIEACTSRGQRVADPFAGVASTCVAAKNTSRTWWGCEISEKYWNSGEERLA